MLAPQNGWYVPTSDDIFLPEENLWIPFYEDTLIPRETVRHRGEAATRVRRKGIPFQQVSYFHRLDSYSNDTLLVGRLVNPAWYDCGTFDILIGRLPSHPSHGRIASRPRYEGPLEGLNILAEIEEWPESVRR